MKEASALYRLLGDEARLRLLRVLARERLNVTELTGVLGLAQSGVSRHLGLLKDAGLVAEERDGGFTYYRLAPSLAGSQADGSPLAVALRTQFEDAASDAAVRADEARLQEVLRLRLSCSVLLNLAQGASALGCHQGLLCLSDIEMQPRPLAQ